MADPWIHRDEIGFLVDALQRPITERFHEHLSAGGSPGKPSWRFVMRDMRPGGLTVSELATRAGVTTQAISQVVREMEREGLVSRSKDPDDRRVTRVVLTEAGESFYRRVRQAHAEMEDTWRAELGAERVEALRALLRDLLHHVRDADPRFEGGTGSLDVSARDAALDPHENGA